MSLLLNNPGTTFLRQNEYRIHSDDFIIAVEGAWELDPAETGTYTSEFWPNRSTLGDVDTGLMALNAWAPFPILAGAASRFGFAGVTRDQYGSPIGSCTVMLYRTSDNGLQDIQTSDPTTGVFLLNTPYYPDAHYIVAHKSGSPDVDGVTPNTLIAAV